MKKLIYITTTATLRPEILENTYKSFWENVFTDNYNYCLNINIDPIGDERYTEQDILSVARKYFKDVYYSWPCDNNFARAVRTMWSCAYSDYMFNLEDMWLSLSPCKIDDLVHILDTYSDIAAVNLHKYVLADGSPPPNFYKSYKTKEDKKLFLQIEKPLLSPGLFRGSYVRAISDLMNDEDNPELQLWGDKRKPRDGKGDKEIIKYSADFDYALFTGNWKFPFWECRKPAVSMFQGRVWKKQHNITKKDHFAKWEKKV